MLYTLFSITPAANLQLFPVLSSAEDSAELNRYKEQALGFKQIRHLPDKK